MCACHREPAELSLPCIETGVDVRVNDILIINDSTWLACGGTRGSAGWIFSTANRGESWQSQRLSSQFSIYDLAWKGATIMAGGEFLQLWESADSGATWQFHWLAEQVPYHEQDRPAIRSMVFADELNGFLAGGENLGEGVIYRTADGGQNWSFHVSQHEYRDLGLTTSGLVVCGHGSVMISNTNMASWQRADVANGFYTALAELNGDWYMASFDGRILKSTDDCISWSGYAQSENQWLSLSANEGRLAVAGAKGRFGITEKSGTISHYTVSGEPPFFKCVLNGSTLFLCSNHGRIYKWNVQ